MNKDISFLRSIKWIFTCFVVAFFIFAGNAQAQQQTIACDTHTPSDPPTDKDILILFYCATDGDNWTNNSGWLSDELPALWHGVSLNADDRVDSLSLSQNMLSGEIPTELGQLTALQYLYLWG